MVPKEAQVVQELEVVEPVAQGQEVEEIVNAKKDVWNDEEKESKEGREKEEGYS